MARATAAAAVSIYSHCSRNYTSPLPPPNVSTVAGSARGTVQANRRRVSTLFVLADPARKTSSRKIDNDTRITAPPPTSIFRCISQITADGGAGGGGGWGWGVKRPIRYSPTKVRNFPFYRKFIFKLDPYSLISSLGSRIILYYQI